MYKFRRYSKRTIAAILSLMIVISAISGLFSSLSAFALDEADVTILNTTTGLSASNSVADGSKVKIGFQKNPANGVSSVPAASNTIGNLCDNNFSNQTEVYWSAAPFYDLKEGYAQNDKTYDAIGTKYLDGSERFFQAVLPLKGKTNLSNILVVNHSAQDLQTYYYEVFASTDEATLFDAGNSVYKYTNTAQKQIQNFQIADGKLTDITFVGLRIYNPCYIDANNEWNKERASQLTADIYYPRIFEFNAYGTVTAPTDEAFSVVTTDDATIPSDLGDKAYSDVTAKFYNAVGANSATFTMAKLQNMLDDNSGTERQFMDNTLRNAEFTENGGEYMNFDFEIKNNFIIRKLLVMNHTSPYLATKRYNIYVSDTKDGLDSAAPLVAYDNANNDATQVFTVKDESGIKAKFVRIKVLLPFDWAKFKAQSNLTASHAVCRFLEMGVFGDYDASAKFQYDLVQSDVTASNLTYPEATNVTAGITPTVEYKNSVTGATASGFGAPEKLNDADYSTDYHTGDRALHTYMDGETLKWYTKADGVYTQITYNLGTVDTITDIVINNHNTPAIRMGSYEIYVSDTLAGLEKEASMVGVVYTNANRQQTIHFTNEVKGQYVRLRTYDVCSDKSWKDASSNNVYLRLHDFVVYGTKGNSSANEKVVLKTQGNGTTNPVTGKDLIVKDAKFTDKSCLYSSEFDTTPRVNGSNAPSALVALTDGKVDNEIEIDTRFADGSDKTLTKIYNDGEKAYTNIIYTLDGVADISDIVVMGHSEPDVWGISYKLYAGNSLSTLFDGEPIYTFNNTEFSRTQHFEVKDIKAAYLAMRITAATASTELSKYEGFVNNFGISIIHPRIFDFSVYGTAGEPLDTAKFNEGNSLSLPSADSIIKSTTVKYFNGSEELPKLLTTIANLADNNINNEFMGSDVDTPFAKPDSNPIELYTDRYIKIIHTLRDNATISDIFVGGHPSVDLRPNKYKIYASDNLDTLWDDGSLVYDFTNTNKTKHQQFALVKEAKYVGMLMTEPVNTPFNSDRSANQIYPRLSEFNVYGTADADTPGGSGGSGDPEIRDIMDATIPTGNNIMVGRMPASAAAYNTVTGDTVGVSIDKAGCLNDGELKADWHTGTMGTKYFAQWDAENNKPKLVVDGTVYVDLMYALGGTSTIERVYVGHHETLQRRTKKFEIYASDSDDESLFDPSNLVKTVVNNAGARGQEITFSTPLTGIRNIGIRIINPVYDEAFALTEITSTNVGVNCNVYPRMTEFAVFGTYEADPFVFERVINNTSAAIPSGINLDGLKNLSTPISPKLTGKNTITNETKKVSPGKSANMKDGSFSTESEIMYHFAEWNGEKGVYYVDGQRQLDIYYDLGSKADVKYIVIGNHPTRELVTGKYDVYLSNNKEKLYDEANLYASVDNVKTYKKGGTNQVNVIAFDKNETGVDSQVRYVGIRIHTPVCAVENTETVTVTDTQNHIYPRIREFSVYGNYLDPNYVPGVNVFKDTANMDIAKDILSKGENLLARENVTYMVGGKRADKLSGSPATTERNFWKDNSGAIHYDFNNMQGDHPAMVFKLSKYEMTQINGFAYQGITSNSEPYYASHIRVHVSEERDDVLSDETVVMEYILEDHGMNKGIYYEFPKGKEPQGCYIAVEFVNPVYTADQHVYARLSLLYAWGEQAIVRGYPGNIAENMPIDIYFNDDDKLEKVTEKNLTALETKNMTDSNKDTSALIDTKGKDHDTMEIIYNLCGDIAIDSLGISTLIDSKHGFKTMKVYAASTMAMLNEKESLVWTYKVGSATGNITPSKAFAPAKEMRYLKFVFEGTKDYLKISEIEAIGMDNQKMKTRALTNNLTADDISVTRTDLETGKEVYPTINDSYVEQLIDSDAGTEFVFYEGTIGKHKYDIRFYLGDLRTVSSITNAFYKHFMKYTPGTINVYISENLADIIAADAKPTYVIKKKDIKNGEFVKNIRPMLARYVRFEFLDYPEFEEFINPDGTPRITALIGDIKIIGTKVKGLNPNEDDKKLISFYDEKTGITASILKFNNEVNDIFADAVSIRVTPEKATNWQMRSLQNSQFKVLDKKIYKVEFLDLYGNVVKNLGERDVSISVKTPEGYAGSDVMIGDAHLRVQIAGLNTAYEDGVSTAEYKWIPDEDNKIAILGMTSSDDPYWDTIGELENFEEGNEDDLKGDMDAEIRDEDWYRSIHTEDDMFTVTPVGFDFEEGLRVEIKNISETAPEQRYIDVLSMADGKKVAAYYDIKLYDGDSPAYLGGQWVELSMNVPEAITDRFTDLEMFHIDDYGMVERLWSMVDGNKLIFQTASFSDFVLVGTALDGSTSIDDGTGDFNDGSSPVTGEDARALAVALLFLVAAGYVAVRFGKKSIKE